MTQRWIRALLIVTGSTGTVASIAWLGSDALAELGVRWRPTGKALAAPRITSGEMVRVQGEGVERPFWIDKTEVTVARYRACMDAGACTAPSRGEFCNWGVAERENHPINCVDHAQATTFCEAAGLRLPTSNEWESAARSGDPKRFPWGKGEANDQDCFDRGKKWKYENDIRTGLLALPLGTCPVDAHPRGAAPSGALGLQGNVAEWTATEVESNRFASLGATWIMSLWDIGYYPTPYQFHYAPTFRDALIGFRCARSDGQ